MAVGWSRDGAVQDQIDAGVEDAVELARSRLPDGEGLTHCEECETAIPNARCKAIPGVRLIEQNLARYLEIERLLNDFFGFFNFCLPQCIVPERLHNGGRPVAACCRDKYYAVFDLDHAAFERLCEERERLYGKPADHIRMNPVSPCEYHDPENGCILKSHKSPVCLAFFCRRAIDRLRTAFGIYFYDYLGMHYALEWILTGTLPEREYRELKNNIVDATAKVKNHRIAFERRC